MNRYQMVVNQIKNSLAVCECDGAFLEIPIDKIKGSVKEGDILQQNDEGDYIVIMTNARIAIKTGPPVEGDDFYGREAELKYAFENHISKGVSILLSAPRRVGKTSFSRKMLELAKDKGWKTLYLDVEGISTEKDFVSHFKKEIQSTKWWAQAGEKVVQIFKSINIEEVEFMGAKAKLDIAWRNDSYGKLRQLIEDAEEILIVIDELTIYLNHLLAQENGKEKVEFFLEWLRNFRQTTKEITKARWILCSSIGIENFASMHQLSKYFNDIHPFNIGPFSECEAEDFILRLDINRNVQFTKEHIQYILEKLAWYLPFFIQILVEKINFLVCVEGKSLSNDTIDEAYNRLIKEKHFNTWDERLTEYGELEDSARKILNSCTLPDGESRGGLLAKLSARKSDHSKTETVLAKLLAMLQNDGYLVENNGKYCFRSPLLRDFWYDRFIK